MEDESSQTRGCYRWVLAFDKETGERVGVVGCPQGQVAARRMLFEMDGYRVEVLTDDELDAYIAAGGE